MNAIIIRALLAALVNERVVDRLLALLDHAIKRRNDEQTAKLTEQLGAIETRLQHVEQLGDRLEQLEHRVVRLEQRVFPKDEGLPSEWDGES